MQVPQWAAGETLAAQPRAERFPCVGIARLYSAREDRGRPAPVSIERACPACGAVSNFELVAQQPADGRAGLMPLYDCSACETMRSILGLLSYVRRTDRAAACRAPPRHPRLALLRYHSFQTSRRLAP